MELISYEKLPDGISAEKLQQGSICAALTDDSVRFLMQQGELYRVNKDESVYHYEDKTDGFFILCQGTVDLYKKYNEGICHIRTVKEGEEFGFVAMISLVPRIADAHVRADSIVLKIPTALFHQLHKEYPFDFGLMTLNLARDMARMINKVSNSLVEAIYD